jgi:hypothetical protein
VETFVGRKSKTNLCRPEYFVRSEGGVAVRGKVWKEILVALEKVKKGCIAGGVNDRKGAWSL